jgi:hypothetical protein
VLLQAKGHLHGGAKGVLPRHKNIDCKRCIKESWSRKKEEEECDYWFNHLRPMTKLKQTWWEKWLAKEEGGSSGEEASKVTSTRGEDKPGSGDGNPELGNCNPEPGNCHPESGNRNPDSGNSNLGMENDWQVDELVLMDINMVFKILAEFCAPTEDVAELALGVERVVFEKPENPGAHMKPLFIWDTWMEHRSDICSLMEVQVLTSCHYSRSSATSKVILNVQILALAVLQVIRRRQKE